MGRKFRCSLWRGFLSVIIIFSGLLLLLVSVPQMSSISRLQSPVIVSWNQNLYSLKSTFSPDYSINAVKFNAATTTTTARSTTTPATTPVKVTKRPLRRSRQWPLYSRYDTENVTAETSKPDKQLLEKIEQDMLMIENPIFRLKNAENDFKIPKIIHQSWKDDKIPYVASVWVKKWTRIHPHWVYIFWTDEKARYFVQEYYPNLAKYYDSWTLPVQKSDMFRILAIYAFGGVWADLDMQPLKQLDPVLDWSACILGRHPDIQTYLIDITDRANIYATNYTYPINSFFACRPGHPFMFYMISRLLLNSPKHVKKPCHISRTVGCSGPRLMALSWAFYLRSVGDLVRSRPELDVICPSSDWFIPTFDTTYRNHLPRIRRRCRKPADDKEQELCKLFMNTRNVPRPHSFTVHRWFHSYNFKKRTRFVVLPDLITNTYDHHEDKFDIVKTKLFVVRK